jgi:hypothetical protein
LVSRWLCSYASDKFGRRLLQCSRGNADANRNANWDTDSDSDSDGYGNPACKRYPNFHGYGDADW